MSRTNLLRALSALAALAVLIWLLDRVGWQRIGELIGRVGPVTAVTLVALGMTETLLDSMALRIPFDGRIRRRAMFGYQSAGALLNLVVPLEAGEVLKATLIGRHVPTGEAISGTIIWNYLLKIARPAVCMAAAAVGLGFGMTVSREIQLGVLAAATAGFVPYLAVRLVVHAGLAATVVRLGRLLRLLRRDPLALLERAERVDHSVRTFSAERPRAFRRVLALQIAARLVGVTTVLLVLHTLGVYTTMPTGLLIFAGMSSAEYLLLAAPARVGVNEGAAYLVFLLFALDPAVGVLAALLIRVRSVASGGIGSMFALAAR